MWSKRNSSYQGECLQKEMKPKINEAGEFRSTNTHLPGLRTDRHEKPALLLRAGSNNISIRRRSMDDNTISGEDHHKCRCMHKHTNKHTCTHTLVISLILSGPQWHNLDGKMVTLSRYSGGISFASPYYPWLSTPSPSYTNIQYSTPGHIKGKSLMIAKDEG